MASQCLALCQTLASQGQAFTININIHNIFTFSMESKENIPANQGKDKKKSPSTIRRDLLRRQQFLKSKTDQVQTARLDVPAASSEPVTTYITFKCDHCDFIGESKSLVDKHMETIHKEIQCEYCELKILSVNSMKTHVQSAHPHKIIPQIHSLQKLPLQKKDFDHGPSYDTKFTKCLLRGEGCVLVSNKYFSSVKVVINRQAIVHKHIYTCNSCIKFIPPEDQAGSHHLPVGNVK